jgi:hypothetical protein
VFLSVANGENASGGAVLVGAGHGFLPDRVIGNRDKR